MSQLSGLFRLEGDERQEASLNSIDKRNIFQTPAFGAEPVDLSQRAADTYNKSIGNVSSSNKAYEFNPFTKRNGELVNPYINYQKVLDNPGVSERAKEYITKATGLVQSPVQVSETQGYADYTASDKNSVSFNGNLDSASLAMLDVTKELPKLSSGQIKSIIEKHFANSKVVKPSDAEGIFKAQQDTGMSALAILSIGALESGYGTSNIANKTNNIWGYGATNSNPMGNAHRYDQMSLGASQFANEYLNTYYGKYGAKSIYAAGTGNNPAKKGYAYYDDGTINTKWAKDVGAIMGNFYNTAKSAVKSTEHTEGSSSGSFRPGTRIANTAAYNNSAAKGQCVWYVRGRAKEKLGVDTASMGNANQMWYNAGPAKVAATQDNIRPDMIVSYKYGTSSAGQKYGHVIYIEDVVGDTVYYTEGGSGYFKNGTDGVVKTATKDGILKGVNTSGKRMGSSIIGLIDVKKL